jgi:hypothetical protein
MTLPDLAGLVGVAAVLSAYALLQVGRLAVRAPLYSLLNLIGSALILLSLVYSFNLPAAIIEGAWALVSLYGLGAALRERATGERAS